MWKSLLIALLFLAPAATAQTKQSTPPASAPATNEIIGSAKAPLPPREADYIRIIQDARRQYLGARSNDARRNARMAMQSAVHNFMGLSHGAQNWVGIFKDSHKTPAGTQSVAIEISPGVTIATWENPATDETYRTMFQQSSPMGKLMNSLAIGDEVVFSADLLGAVVSSDEEMVLRPRVIAHFTKLEKIAPAAN